MAKYHLGYRVETALSSLGTPRRQFNYEGHQIDLVFNEEGSVECHIELEADTYVQAYELAADLITNLVGVVTFVTGTSLQLLELFIILKAEPGNPTRTMFYIRKEEHRRGPNMRDAVAQSIQTVIDAGQLNASILKSLRWLRYNIRARTLIEAFSYGWLALEALSGQAQIQPAPCPHCGGVLPPHPGINKDKAKEIFLLGPGNNGEQFDRVWNCRHDLFHGRRTINLRDLAELNEPLFNGVMAYLKDKLQPPETIDVRVGPTSITTNQAFFTFTTSNPAEEIPADYPSEEDVKAYFDDPNAQERPKDVTLLGQEQDELYRSW